MVAEPGSTPSPLWTPANDGERALARALGTGDHRAYFQALTRMSLYVPAAEAAGEDLAGPPPLLIWRLAERTYLVVYTSPELLAVGTRGVARGYRTTSYPELCARWPDASWWLAINPALPYDCYLPVGSVRRAAVGELTVPVAGAVLASIVCGTRPAASPTGTVSPRRAR